MQKKIAMIEENENFFDEIFELFVVSKTANGVSDATLRNYHYHRKAISKYLDTNRPIASKGIVAHNTRIKNNRRRFSLKE